jgi:DNA-binding beta-propeller fold protein YncE
MIDKRIPVPEFPDTLQWLNVDEPVRLGEQRGKVVLLHYWCYSNVQCQHTLADLAYLEQKYRDVITVIGIYSPVFTTERSIENARKSVQRLQIRHAVIFDPELKLLKRFGVRSTPTVIYIDHEGNIVGMLPGTGRRAQLEKLIKNSIAEMPEHAKIVARPVFVNPYTEFGHELSFPGHVVATSDRLFISDSGHHRILETMHSGRILRVYGSGTASLIDAVGEEAGFNNPQGLAYSDDKLYVADTGNHSIRVVDIVTSEVSTIAGTGRPGNESVNYSDAPLQVSLNTPWGLKYENGMLFIAMMGMNQIWQLNLGLKMIRSFAGNGREGFIDGNAEQAAFAQPSAVAAGRLLEPELFVLDASASAVRSIRLRDMRVKTLFGLGPRNYGDEDGDKMQAKLQHPMDIVFDKEHYALWIADTYNNKIKHVDLRSLKMTSTKINYEFNEPHAVSLANNCLWIANTNDHEIVKVDLASGEVETVDMFAVHFN